MKKIYLVLICLLLLGGALRTLNLSKESIWQDEGFALRNAQQKSLSEFIKMLQNHDGTPPLYFFFLRYWIKGGMEEEWQLRLPSVIFSILAILFVFLIGKELKKEKVGLIAATLMSLSVIHTVYAQEVRPYALFTLLITISTWAFLRFTNGKSPIPYVISTALLLYTHNFALFVVSLQILAFLCFFKDNNFKQYLYSIIAIAILYLPNMFIFTRHQFENVQISLRTSLAQKLGLPVFIANLGGLNFFIIFLLGLGMIYLIYRKSKGINLKQFIQEKHNLIFILLCLGLLSSFFIVPYLLKSIFITRYTHWAYLLLYLIIAYVFCLLKNPQKKVIAALYILLIIFSFFLYHTVDRKEQWEEVSVYVESQNAKNIYIIDDSLQYPFSYYYAGKITPIDTKLSKEEHKVLLEKIKREEDFWIIYSHAYEVKVLYEKTLSNFTHSTKNFNGAEVVHYTK